MKGKKEKTYLQKATYLHKTTKKMAFLKTVKKVNWPRKTVIPGNDKQNPDTQLCVSLMEVPRWNSVLIQMGAFRDKNTSLTIE